MRKLSILILVLLATAAWAADIPSAQTPLLLTGDGSGGTVSSTNPFPVNLASSTISILASSAPPGSATTTTVLAGSTSASVSAFTNRVNVAFFNLGTNTVWLDIGSGTAVVSSGIPIPASGYFSMDADPNIAIAYIASVSTYLTITQGGQ